MAFIQFIFNMRKQIIKNIDISNIDLKEVKWDTKYSGPKFGSVRREMQTWESTAQIFKGPKI